MGLFGNKNIMHAVDVARWRLCVGCGACDSICPQRKIILKDVLNEGIRPFWAGEQKLTKNLNCDHCSLCLEVCPGVHMSAPAAESCQTVGTASMNRMNKKWGNVLELWEGFASDPEVRLWGSSGGLCTALSLFCLEKGYAEGVLHVGALRDSPWKNKTFLSTTREELISRTGSRYAPASPCDSLNRIEGSSKPVVFIGKPCDIAALRMAQDQSTQLKQNIALAIGFFCAGTPSTKGTLDLLEHYGASAKELTGFRYRGHGWPGEATAWFKDSHKEPLKLTYEQSWGFLQRYRPFRCHLCPDGTAQLADISCGDAWYKKGEKDNPGLSLVLVRTERGKKVLHEAMDAGYVRLTRVSFEVLEKSQINLLNKKRALWGRLLAMKAFGIPTPHFEGYSLYENWLDLPIREKVRSVLGTVRRIVHRKYYKPKEETGLSD